jgi:hypothetical protein
MPLGQWGTRWDRHNNQPNKGGMMIGKGADVTMQWQSDYNAMTRCNLMKIHEWDDATANQTKQGEERRRHDKKKRFKEKQSRNVLQQLDRGEDGEGGRWYYGWETVWNGGTQQHNEMMMMMMRGAIHLLSVLGPSGRGERLLHANIGTNPTHL